MSWFEVFSELRHRLCNVRTFVQIIFIQPYNVIVHGHEKDPVLELRRWYSFISKVHVMHTRLSIVVFNVNHPHELHRFSRVVVYVIEILGFEQIFLCDRFPKFLLPLDVLDTVRNRPSHNNTVQPNTTMGWLFASGSSWTLGHTHGTPVPEREGRGWPTTCFTTANRQTDDKP